MSPPTSPHLLHEIEFPDPAICGVRSLYVRLPDTGAALDLTGPTVRIAPYTAIDFDTYFNCFSVEVWNRSAPLDDLSVEVDVDGPCSIEVWSATSTGREEADDDASRAVVAAGRTHETPPGSPSPSTLLVPDHHRLRGVLYLRVQALEDPVVFRGARWITTTTPRRDVRLGAAMTTFNRQEYVQRNVALLDRYARAAPHHLEDVRVQIVDNGSNLALERDRTDLDIRLLPNRNLGGAGGFARNLMEYRDEGWATHLVFMDDDISVAPAILDRTRVFLRYTTDPSACVSGAMLDEDRRAVQFESGAHFALRARHPYVPVRTQLDLTEALSLCANSRDVGIEYAGWWFFAFPIDLTDDNPLPVFVRGDDVEFCLTHARGHIEAMNGIGVWHQAFEYKNSPMMFHLEYRNLPLVSVLGDPGFGRKHFVRRFLVAAGRALMAMKYSSAQSILDGTKDFLAGPDRWLEIDHVEELARMRAFDGEKLAELPAGEVPREFRDARGLRRRVRSLLAIGLLGGHALPRRLSRRPRVAVPVQLRSISAPLGREEIVYYYRPTSEGFAARRDRRRFVAVAVDLARTVGLAWRRFPVVAEEYRARRSEMVSDAYWRRQFGPAGTSTAPDRVAS